jgi:hypothetical protein
MLEKLLRARLPEQIVALIEKLEQDPDASHLDKVMLLLNNGETVFTRYEHWVLKRAVRKCRTVILREQTLNRVMRIVINEPVHETVPGSYTYVNGIQGAGMSLTQHGALHQRQIDAIRAQQAQQQYAQGYQGYFNSGTPL